MRIIKPQHLSVLHRCFEDHHRAYLGVSIMAYLPLCGDIALLSEQAMWQEILPLLDSMTPLDTGIPKPGSEYLIVGDACAPHGVPTQELEVSARVGKLHKTVRIIGNRVDKPQQSKSPEQFSRMPTGWSHTYGGKNYPQNPLGRGIEFVDTPSGKYIHLPCVIPKLAVKDQAPSPVSFSPIPQTWPQRNRFQGTYDEKWLQDLFPSPPEDFNWRFHCCASEDQWQEEEFSGFEEIELKHLNPEMPIIRSRLPGIRPIVITRTKGMSSQEARISSTKQSTVWLFPNQLKMVIVWNSIIEVEDEFADNIELLAVAAEWIGRPKAPEQYLDAIAARLDKENGALKILDDQELLPEGLPTPNDAFERYKNAHGSQKPSLEEVLARINASQVELDAHLSRQLGPDTTLKGRSEVNNILNSLGIPELPKGSTQTSRDLASTGIAYFSTLPSFADLKVKLETLHEASKSIARQRTNAAGTDASTIDAALNPPKQTNTIISPAKEYAASEQRIFESYKAQGMTSPMGNQDLRAVALRSDCSLQAMQRRVTHTQPPPPAMDAISAKQWREEAEQARIDGRSFTGLSLVGADFSGLDLSFVDFSETQLDGVNFAGAILTGANFSRASLAHADLSCATLDNANFEEANLGRAMLRDASCTNGIFKGATLHHTAMNGTKLKDCDFSNVTLNEVIAHGSDWRNSRFSQACFIKCQLPESDFSAAVLNRATFLETSIPQSRFVRAQLEATTFVTCTLDNCNFDECLARNARFTHLSSLRNTSFRAAQAPGANFRNMPLEKSVFSGAILDACDFSEAVITEGNFNLASLKSALLMKAICHNASFVGANLMNAIIQHADLRGADFRDSNLFAADLVRITTDSGTHFERALITKARVHPQRKVLSVVEKDKV